MNLGGTRGFKRHGHSCGLSMPLLCGKILSHVSHCHVLRSGFCKNGVIYYRRPPATPALQLAARNVGEYVNYGY